MVSTRIFKNFLENQEIKDDAGENKKNEQSSLLNTILSS